VVGAWTNIPGGNTYQPMFEGTDGSDPGDDLLVPYRPIVKFNADGTGSYFVEEADEAHFFVDGTWTFDSSVDPNQIVFTVDADSFDLANTVRTIDVISAGSGQLELDVPPLTVDRKPVAGRPAPADSLTFMTFNVAGATFCVTSWLCLYDEETYMLNVVADLIIDNDVDVAGFQEIDTDRLDWVVFGEDKRRDMVAELEQILSDRGYPMYTEHAGRSTFVADLSGSVTEEADTFGLALFSRVEPTEYSVEMFEADHPNDPALHPLLNLPVQQALYNFDGTEVRVWNHHAQVRQSCSTITPGMIDKVEDPANGHQNEFNVMLGDFNERLIDPDCMSDFVGATAAPGGYAAACPTSGDPTCTGYTHDPIMHPNWWRGPVDHILYRFPDGGPQPSLIDAWFDPSINADGEHPTPVKPIPALGSGQLRDQWVSDHYPNFGRFSIGAPDDDVADVENGDALVNGQALITAVAEAASGNPSAADPVEIRLDAGVYDLGESTVDLPDGVNLIGVDPAGTTICQCASPGAGPWFRSPGSNEFAGVTFADGAGPLVESRGGDAVFRNVVVSSVSTGLPNETLLVDASDGTVAIIESELGERPVLDNRLRGIRATGDTSVTVQDSSLQGGGGTFVEVERGRLDIVRSTLDAYVTYSPATVVRAVGAADIRMSESSMALTDSVYSRSEPFRLEAGGTLDVVDSTVNCCGFGANAIIAKDAAITIARSDFDLFYGNTVNDGAGSVELEGGSLHLVNTDIDLRSIKLGDGASGSMSGGQLASRFPNPDFFDSRVVQAETTSGFVFDGVAMKNAIFGDDPNVVCIATTNVVGGDAQSPPNGCTDGRAQSAFGGVAHAVPGAVEVEDYDVGGRAGVSFADNDRGNHRGDYRFDDVDIWATAGEPGYTVGRTRGGEWLEYTIDVAAAAPYEVGVRLATGFADPGAVRVSVDGSPVGTIADMPINGWWNFSTESVGVVDLAAGTHVLRLDIIGNGQINLDRIEIATTLEGPCGGLAQEGEAGSVSGSMEAFGSALVSAPGTPNKYVFDDADFAEYCVIAPATGHYELAATVTAIDSSSDSFYVQLNDDDPVTWHIAPRGQAVTRTAPGLFKLVAGENVVRFHHRETGTELDRFEFAQTAVVPGPVAPTSCSVTRSGNVATITFTAASADNAERYLLYRTEDGGSSQWSASILSSADPSFAFTETDGVTYRYGVKTRGAHNTFTGLTACQADGL